MQYFCCVYIFALLQLYQKAIHHFYIFNFNKGTRTNEEDKNNENGISDSANHYACSASYRI